jgi:hypothetical protein
MSLIDGLNRFSNAQAVTAAAASTEVDLKAVYDPGAGNPLWIVVACVVDMTDGSSDSTLVVTLRQAAATGMGSPDTLATIGTFPAVSVAGTKLVYAVPPGLITKQFLDLYYTPTSGNLSTGSFDAFITADPNMAKLYADNVDFSMG